MAADEVSERSAGAAAADAALVELRGAAFGYGREPVVRDVDLAVRRGEMLGIVGPNGAGKTTLFRGILGLLSPLQGTVVRRTTSVGYVPQREVLDALYPLTARDLVRMGAYGRLRGLRRLTKQDRALAHECLARVGLEHRARESFADLSGGQRQRALLARALMVRPDLLVLDEPTSGIDALAADRILDLLEHLAHREGVAVLLVSHQAELLRERVDRALWVAGGRVEAGPAAEILAPARLARLFAAAAEA